MGLPGSFDAAELKSLGIDREPPGPMAIKMPDPKDDPKSFEWRPYAFARDQWHCRICGDRFLYSEMVRKHIASEHNETMPPTMYEYFRGAVWHRKKLP